MKANHITPLASARRIAAHACKLIAATYLLSVVSPTAWAEGVYTYRDENGQWIFTDQKPDSPKQAKSVSVKSSKQAEVSVVDRGNDQQPELYAVNKIVGPVQVWLDFSQTENVKFSSEAPFEWMIRGPKEELILKLEPADPEQEWSYGWSYGFVPGVPTSIKALDSTPLAAPIKGGPFVISQSFEGSETHSEFAESQYAVDIAVPMNTPVVAVRSGMVMDVEQDSSASGWSAKYASDVNMVRVLHADGSMALYSRLRVDGVRAVPGQRVRKGQVLGYSGKSGGGASHLHFALQINSGKKLVSVPFQFEGYKRAPQKNDILGP